MNIAIYIYDEAEVLDFSGPYEVFSVANRFLEESKKHKLFLVSQNKEVKARGDYKVLSHYTIDNHPKIDVLVVAGGVHTGELKKDEVISWISKIAKNAKLVASVCTGAFLLAKAEVIKEHKVTTHWEDIPDLKKDFPLLKVVEDVRWVDEGDIVTSAGISAGIDMSLHLISKHYSLELAQKVAKQMQFDWTKNS
ncbi:glutamine amidotransferase [Halarcobacter ebronensis]|uniref:Glutamine amidotransferase n=1 Tax=Halarcobacter ebronensis TaxID=1462615 RepID=A0A4Q0YBK9_9BACT|nr:DJ-1/PfpI family protein [Halarcobacter ebronensis]RXJ67730.1 glutamine amidotransferase [Halarcobacter ebronensis]